MNKNSRIWVTGATGLVGSNLVETLKQQGYENVLTDRVNLQDRDSVWDYFIFNKPEYIFHCAARVGGIKANINDPYGFLFDNLQLNLNLIDTILAFGVKKVVILGSSCIYPKDCAQPMKEEYLLDGKLEPTNEGYALSKIVSLKLAEYANKQYSETKFVNLMPCNVMGPNDKFGSEYSHFLSALITKFHNAVKNNEKEVTVWGDGKSKRELIHVYDLVDAMIWSMNNIDKTETFLNVGTGIDYSIADYVAFIKEYMKFKGEVKFDFTKPNGMRRKVLDISKITKLGWQPKIGVLEGVMKTIDWYLTES